MNQITRLPTFAFPPEFRRFAIGFDGIFDQLRDQLEVRGSDNYPPYNIIKISDTEFRIELAIAGFTQSEITVETNDRVLNIEGHKEAASEREYIHQGISYRSFQKSFTLADHVEVVGAVVENGLLAIKLEKQIPEHKKPKLIEVQFK